MTKTSRLVHAACVGAVVGLTGCVSPNEEAFEPTEEVTSEVVIDDNDFMPLPTLEAQSETPGDDQIDTFYGRATALTIVPVEYARPVETCSAFLIDDGVAASARSCRMNDNGVVTAPATQIFQWGRYGSGVLVPPFTSAKLWARYRAFSLGIPWSASVSYTSLSRWSCTATQATPNRDIEYFECEPNIISWTEPNGTTIHFSLLPGHIWGHFNTSWEGLQSGDAIRNFGVERLCGDPLRTVITAPGEVVASVSTCVRPFGSCFEVSSDSLVGHDGGPILRRSDHRVVGVVSGARVAPSDLPDLNDPCGEAAAWSSENLATKIAVDIANFTGAAPDGDAEPAGPYTGIGATVGGTGGVSRTLQCPPDYLAAGVIGSTLDGWVGNMGLICMPNRDYFDSSSTGDVTSYRLDRAVVVAGGSFDTNFATTFGADFNTYMSETLSVPSSAPKTAPGRSRQYEMMCPPGMYLRGISGFESSSYTGKVTELECAPPHAPTATTTRQLLVDIGSRDASDGLTMDTTRCSDGFLFGLIVRSGWLTDSYRARCRRAW